MCNYCESIKNSTPASPRKKYNYCPMCGKNVKPHKNKDQKFLDSSTCEDCNKLDNGCPGAPEICNDFILRWED